MQYISEIIYPTLIGKKVSAGIGAMRRMKNFVPVPTLETVYKGLFQPYFEYCSSLWETCGKLLKDKLQRLQSGTATVLTGATYDICSADLMDSHSWETLDDRRHYAKLILMYNLLNDYTALGLRNSFVRRNLHQVNYHLCNRDTDLTVPKPKREFLKRSFEV